MSSLYQRTTTPVHHSPRCWQCSVWTFFVFFFVVLFFFLLFFYIKLKLCTNGLARTRRRSPRTVLMALGHRQSTVRSSLYGDVTKSKAWFDTGKFWQQEKCQTVWFGCSHRNVARRACAPNFCYCNITVWKVYRKWRCWWTFGYMGCARSKYARRTFECFW